MPLGLLRCVFACFLRIWKTVTRRSYVAARAKYQVGEKATEVNKRKRMQECMPFSIRSFYCFGLLFFEVVLFGSFLLRVPLEVVDY